MVNTLTRCGRGVTKGRPRRGEQAAKGRAAKVVMCVQGAAKAPPRCKCGRCVSTESVRHGVFCVGSGLVLAMVKRSSTVSPTLGDATSIYFIPAVLSTYDLADDWRNLRLR